VSRIAAGHGVCGACKDAEKSLLLGNVYGEPVVCRVVSFPVGARRLITLVCEQIVVFCC